MKFLPALIVPVGLLVGLSMGAVDPMTKQRLGDVDWTPNDGPARPELPPFSGDTPTCVKCGNEGAYTRFMAYGDCTHDSVGGSCISGWHANERLHRECRRCGYQWDEATNPPTTGAAS